MQAEICLEGDGARAVSRSPGSWSAFLQRLFSPQRLFPPHTCSRRGGGRGDGHSQILLQTRTRSLDHGASGPFVVASQLLAKLWKVRSHFFGKRWFMGTNVPWRHEGFDKV